MGGGVCVWGCMLILMVNTTIILIDVIEASSIGASVWGECAVLEQEDRDLHKQQGLPG
jgi:hypothetical protein